MYYKDLRIYKLAVRLRDELHEELNKISQPWNNKDIDQAKRSSSSAVSNIVEGYGRRFHPRDLIKFLNYSITSSDETQNHTRSLGKDDYLSIKRSEYFQRSYKTLSIQTLNYLNYHRKKHNI
ncbi:four helix bundle protein [Patescibacteria group bacterium]|nr:four helix bundle protein [Patescibacteria group bacterium]